jgi:hypothetical protein
MGLNKALGAAMRPALGHGSNPAPGDAERIGAAAECAEVFALLP